MDSDEFFEKVESGYVRKILAQNPRKIRTDLLQKSMKHSIFGGDFLLRLNFIILTIKKSKRHLINIMDNFLSF